MNMTHDQIASVHESFQKLRKVMEPASKDFYDTLFARRPDLRTMFRDDLTGQGMKFMSTLGVLLENLENPAAVEAHYRDLGRTHRTLGVKPDHYAPMEKALIDTMRTALGEGFTPELEAAWRAAYADFSGRMIGAS